MTIGLKMTGGEGGRDRAAASGRDECYWMTQINKATLVTNARCGLLDRRQAGQFARAQKRVEERLARPDADRPGIYIRYEPLMIEEAGYDVTLMHAGRSSQDIHATFLRTITRDEMIRVCRALNDVRGALYQLAYDNRDVLAPGYTNGVAAQPNLIAHQWLGHLSGFERDFDRIRGYFSRLNRCPMGTTVLNGTCWPLDRRAMAELLGFDGPIDNAYDAAQIDSEDEIIEASQVLVMPMIHIGHFIADVMTQYAQARPWILVGATYVSSAMPQKRNPGSLIDVRRDASAVISELQSAIWRSHNLMPGMYDAKDQRINSDFLADAAAVLQAFASVLPKLSINGQRALEEINSEWTASQNIADILMRDHSVAFRLGHRFASTLVTRCRERSLTPVSFPFSLAEQVWEEMAASLPEGAVSAVLPLSERELREALDPRAIVKGRRTLGGPQDEEMARMFNRTRVVIEADRRWIDNLQSRLDQAQNELQAEFDRLAKEE